MVVATSEALERVSAERRARWLRQRRRRRAFWLVVAVAIAAGIGAALWPRGGTPLSARLAAQAAAPLRRMPVRPLPALPNSLSALRAALPAAEGVTHGDPAERMVALTFDDGPSGRTPAILRVLANHHMHATFFVVGRSTRGMEPVLRHIAATGNELADHTYSHADLLALGATGRRRQLEWTRGLVARATGIQPRFFRPPYGATGPAVNRLGRSLGLIPVLWSVDSRDWQLPGTRAIVRRVLAHVRPGSIVLMHDGGGDRRETLRALPAILRALERRHLKVVTLSRLFASAPPASAFWSGSFAGGDART
ncbi:MAG: peptidoglycan-N-acetylglucosamine deacetylase [Gaiellales bacterium]|jgi:peptidoglycan/xylan/chitin deacetylase (PgdA/CDA1 family)|nr:peptidoglycan-N-acetylglucosamine deacetylase [Gaiellales bacterium]